ncbi:MAG: 3-isopropylmalate dehydratase large subunit [Chloroflexi bacterium]|nr:3-isopropylmalate dehydratase large subunit [Chloroflexi bacterium CFX1]MCK6568632.1 3-isopropylmalate dehydratase large subunit [Anaerolineales bacterium]MCQ3952818.1 3-isopropylmalate dehydratase large subunit [Chloroflexota bacterium]MDL1917881.1 3-isopropylmalate dehydratase large subunit [Chloroflexi bacterium CFX5]NUQ59606.1 3-isopropylmalate dehydratase large subunit [Anaerolineales bacterium]
MAHTLAEKILAEKCDQKKLSPGQFINARVDLVMASELSGVLAIEEFEKIKGARVWDPQKVVFIMDHFTPAKDIKSAEIVKQCREFANQHGIRFYDVGRAGIQHILLPEQGMIVPGDLIAGADSHTCTHGFIGAFGTGVGSTDAAVAMALGELWMKVPESIKFVYHGKPRKWVRGKDLILHTIARIGVEGARYQAMEFTGEALQYLDMSDRFSMANMAIEAGAKAGLFAADDMTRAFIRARGRQDGLYLQSDPDAEYANVYEFDVTEFEPFVAVPFIPENVKPVSQLGDVEIDQAVIGMCTNGNLEDLRAAAEILKGHQIHPRVRAVVIPGSQKVYLDALKEGLIEVFIEANCSVSTPTCGPCLGGHMGVLAAGEKCISTSNRNFRGRMGHVSSELYLANPYVAAASAIAGRIISPEEL